MRRISLRLQNTPRPYYGSDHKRSRKVEEDVASNKKAKQASENGCSPNRQAKNVKAKDASNKKGKQATGNGCSANHQAKNIKAKDASNKISKQDLEKGCYEAKKVKSEDGKGKKNKAVLEDACKWVVPGSSLIDDHGISCAARVKETLRIFNSHYLQFVQEEEKRCKQKKNGNSAVEKRPSKRPDLKAVSKMLKNKETLNLEKTFGNVPGIEVGHQFFSRAEMVAVGFHGHWLKGIDYMGNSYAKNNYKGYTFPLAVAIVLSGQYEDDVDKSEEVVYTGQGGNDLLGNKRQIKDQVMACGNLALKNNMEHGIPVRVVRGHKCTNSYSKKVYTYDGLYQVVDNWAEKGVAGFTVFKYRLKRLPGQPQLVTNQVLFSRLRGSKALSEISGLVCRDICKGQETICIPATNVVDNPPVAPDGFTYIKSVKVASNVKIPPSAPGCKCKGKCNNPQTCACAQRNGDDFPYVSQDGGRLIEAKDVVFECGPNCGCGPECVNRTSQRGLKYRLEVFRTPAKGWGVRSWDYIPSGAPVCEYVGVLKKSDELDNVSENDYIFEVDCWQTINGIGGRERRMGDVTLPSNNVSKRDAKILNSTPEFSIDAGTFGNISRFINHSCDPNLFVQCVLSSHHDIKLARVVLFAADNIPPLQELTYDYGYELNSVIGPNGKLKKMACHCGAAICRKRLY
ncbi:hypothetical protein UlMin_039994 [Ulmus minor]